MSFPLQPSGRTRSILNVAVAIAIVQDARSEPHGQVEGGDLVAPPREVHEQLVAPRAPPCEEALDLVGVRMRVQARGDRGGIGVERTSGASAQQS